LKDRRPYVIPKKYTWKSGDRTETPGIGLLYGTKIRAHLTAKEAYALADKLVDLADKLDATENAA
jgi:hypothetical protein